MFSAELKAKSASHGGCRARADEDAKFGNSQRGEEQGSQNGTSKLIISTEGPDQLEIHLK